MSNSASIPEYLKPWSLVSDEELVRLRELREYILWAIGDLDTPVHFVLGKQYVSVGKLRDLCR